MYLNVFTQIVEKLTDGVENNTIVSPMGQVGLLTMILAGAGKSTSHQMKGSLGFNLHPKREINFAIGEAFRSIKVKFIYFLS